MSIEGSALEHFSALPHTELNSSTKACPRHTVFYYLLSDDNKQYAATTTAHSNCLVELLKEQKLMTSALSTM